MTGDAYGPYDPDFVAEERQRVARDKVPPQTSLFISVSACPRLGFQRPERRRSWMKLLARVEAHLVATCACNGQCVSPALVRHAISWRVLVRLQERARRKKQASKGQQKRLPAVSSVIEDFDEDDDDDFDDEDY